MKSFKIICAAAALAALAACGGQAHAAPTLVANTAGTVVYGSEQAVSAEKDTSAGYNRVAVRYASGTQYINDDAAWSKFAKVVSGFYIPVAASQGKVYDAAKASIIYCSNNQSSISWPNVGPADNLSDGCAFFNAVKAAAQ